MPFKSVEVNVCSTHRIDRFVGGCKQSARHFHRKELGVVAPHRACWRYALSNRAHSRKCVQHNALASLTNNIAYGGGQIALGSHVAYVDAQSAPPLFPTLF